MRFFWHVEGGYSAYITPGGMSLYKDTGVRQASCEIEIPGQKETLPALLTLPPDYLNEKSVKDVGVVLGHGANAADWKGKFLTELAVILAQQGYVVMRCCCKQKEQRRQRMYEKALDACATSPFGRGITRWVLAGFGSGARVAAVVGNRCRGKIAGFVLLSYPLQEPLPVFGKTKKLEPPAPQPKTSEAPLLKVKEPVLFISGDADELCEPAALVEVCRRMTAPDVRLSVISDTDSTFKAPAGRGPAIAVVRQIGQMVTDFVDGVGRDNLSKCSVPRISRASSLAGAGSPARGHKLSSTSSGPQAVPAQQRLQQQDSGLASRLGQAGERAGSSVPGMPQLEGSSSGVRLGSGPAPPSQLPFPEPPGTAMGQPGSGQQPLPGQLPLGLQQQNPSLLARMLPSAAAGSGALPSGLNMAALGAALRSGLPQSSAAPPPGFPQSTMLTFPGLQQQQQAMPATSGAAQPAGAPAHQPTFMQQGQPSLYGSHHQQQQGGPAPAYSGVPASLPQPLPAMFPGHLTSLQPQLFTESAHVAPPQQLPGAGSNASAQHLQQLPQGMFAHQHQQRQPHQPGGSSSAGAGQQQAAAASSGGPYLAAQSNTAAAGGLAGQLQGAAPYHLGFGGSTGASPLMGFQALLQGDEEDDSLQDART